ncbi:energy transducer TonB [Thalassotalea psychrophila]|uniref:Protein TonB n=1 Tax=Thalassotalea psychrophila TaxID=3065647 RepID=A0ABY9TX94_9GAMM|nr:energy transducer TonB [Colwelliaceae bacterium SQ149]
MLSFRAITCSFAIVGSFYSSLALADTSQVDALKAKIQTRDRTLLTHVEPIYPKQAFEDALKGSVTMSFTVSTDGSITDIIILESIPKGVFDAASVTALKQWKYAAVEESIMDVKTKFDFAP